MNELGPITTPEKIRAGLRQERRREWRKSALGSLVVVCFVAGTVLGLRALFDSPAGPSLVTIGQGSVGTKPWTLEARANRDGTWGLLLEFGNGGYNWDAPGVPEVSSISATKQRLRYGDVTVSVVFGIASATVTDVQLTGTSSVGEAAFAEIDGRAEIVELPASIAEGAVAFVVPIRGAVYGEAVGLGAGGGVIGRDAFDRDLG